MKDRPIDFKEQMVEARRTQILMGAAQIFSEKGFHGATTKEIAQAAEVSEGTIYNYFDNKRELLVAMMELLGRRSLNKIVQDDPPADAEAFLKQILSELYHFLQERGQFAGPILAEIFTDKELRQSVYNQVAKPLVAYLETHLHRQTPLGKMGRYDLTVETYALMGAMLLNFVLKSTQLDPRYEQISEQALIDQLVSFFLEGLEPENGLSWLIS